MTPYEQAKAVYQREPCARTFEHDLELHFMHGYVISNPHMFAMGRAVHHGAAPEEIVNPEVRHRNCDCWHVYLMAGDVDRVWYETPFPLPFISFERNNRLRIYRTDALRRRLLQFCRAAHARNQELVRGTYPLS